MKLICNVDDIELIQRFYSICLSRKHDKQRANVKFYNWHDAVSILNQALQCWFEWRFPGSPNAK